MKITDDKTAFGICVVLFVVCVGLLVFLGFRAFSWHTDSIGPNNLADAFAAYDIVVDSPIVFKSDHNYYIRNIVTKEVIKPNLIAPDIGEEHSQYIITNPSLGTYRVPWYTDEVYIYSLESSSVTMRLNIPFAVGLMIFLTVLVAIVYVGLSYLVIRHL